MSAERARQLAEEALDRLAAALEAGHSETLREYLAAQARFRRYSWNNVLLIATQRPTATRVAGFHTWHELGRSVKRGEKGITIFAPILTRKQETTATLVGVKSQETNRVAGFRATYVFDVEQTEGLPLPQFAATTGDPKDYAEKLRAMVTGRGIALEYDPSIAPAQGVSSGGRIRLLPELSAAEEFSTLAHELAHEMLHHRAGEPSLSKTVRETQAEAVAYVVCHGVGLDTNTAAADYIALYNGDKKTLAQSLSAIQETSSQILKEILPEERAIPTREVALDVQADPRSVPQLRPEDPADVGRPEPPLRLEPGDSASWNR